MTSSRVTGAVSPAATGEFTASVELAVSGMTCTSCAARIEKKLNRLDGVDACVNYATEKAAVRYDPTRLSPADLVATVEATGYTARLPQTQASAAVDHDEHDPDVTALATLRSRLLVSTVLTVPGWYWR